MAVATVEAIALDVAGPPAILPRRAGAAAADAACAPPLPRATGLTAPSTRP
jgi:hypothetical protein